MEPPSNHSTAKAFKLLHAFLQRHWRQPLRLREKYGLSEEAFHLLLAGGVGVIGGIVNFLFFYGVGLLEKVLVGINEQSFFELGDLGTLFSKLAVPTLGALAAGLILYGGIRLIGKQGSSNMLEVVVAGDGRLPFRTGIVRTLSSMISIATGASIGREGAIMQISATLSSKWGQLAHWQPYRLRLLVACGAASGMAAAYNAPIAGAVFAAQIVLGNFSMSLFAPLLFSSVISAMVSRVFLGNNLLYEIPAISSVSLSDLPWFFILGILAGAIGSLFLKLLVRGQELFKHVPILYWRLALGGLIAGVIALLYPEVRGNGYLAINDILHSHYEIHLLLALLIAKLLATVITVGSGAVGGVFTPTLFLGAALGSFWGMVLNHYNLGPTNLSMGAFALVGMGSMLAATTRSPLLAIIMILEISQNYTLMPILMIACAVSTLVARALHPRSIYTEPLKSRSLEVESYRIGAATEQTVGDLMHAPIPPLKENTSLPDMAERFLASPNNFLPVVNKDQKLIGMVALHDLKGYLNGGDELQAVIATDVMHPPPQCLTPNLRLLDAVPILLASEQRNVPVVNNLTESRLIGSLPRVEALGIVSESIATKAMGAPENVSAQGMPVHQPQSPATK